MTIRDFYKMTEGDYDSLLGRLLEEERVLRFVRMFEQDPTYAELEKRLDERDPVGAFRAAHTLKGVCLNIGLSRLYGLASEVTEALREGDLEAADEKMPALRKDYARTVEAIRQL